MINRSSDIGDGMERWMQKQEVFGIVRTLILVEGDLARADLRLAKADLTIVINGGRKIFKSSVRTPYTSPVRKCRVLNIRTLSPVGTT